MMKQKLLIIGNNSYLATGLAQQINGFEVLTLDIPDFEKDIDVIKSADIIINFAMQPEFSTRPIEKDEIIDLKIAKLIKNSPAKFFFVSSRKVYGKNTELKVYKETDEPKPDDFYAKNKLLAEQLLRAELGDNLCTIRVANIIGEPILRANYNTFIGWITREFVNSGKLPVNENPLTVKDFITREYLQKALCALFKDFKGKTVNLGSGINITIHELLSAVVGEENIILQDKAPIREQFLLDTQNLAEVLAPLTKEELLESCRNYNKLLLTMKQ